MNLDFAKSSGLLRILVIRHNGEKPPDFPKVAPRSLITYSSFHLIEIVRALSLEPIPIRVPYVIRNHDFEPLNLPIELACKRVGEGKTVTVPSFDQGQ
jgi:hypothetical protein